MYNKALSTNEEAMITQDAMRMKTAAEDDDSVTHTINRFKGSGKAQVPLIMNDVKTGPVKKLELGMTGKPTVTKTMQRDFGRTHKGAK